MDIASVLAAVGAGTLLGALLQHQLNRLAERRQRRINSDRATYQERMTRLIAGNVYAFIRSNRCHDGEREQLAEIIQNLSDGAHRQRFLDRRVHLAWLKLVDRTATCGWRRLSDSVTEQDIGEYTRAWETWMKAANEAFGPLPETDLPLVRGSRPSPPNDAAA